MKCAELFFTRATTGEVAAGPNMNFRIIECNYLHIIIYQVFIFAHFISLNESLFINLFMLAYLAYQVLFILGSYQFLIRLKTKMFSALNMF